MDEQVLLFRYDDQLEGRLDKFLVERLPEFSRSRLQGLISAGLVEVDGLPAHKSGQLIASGQEITVRVPPAAPTDLIPENIPLDIVFENDDLLVINKPAGMVVHPAAGHLSGTLVNAVLGYDPDIEGIGGEVRPGVVHRLDKGTSGLIVLARNDRSLVWLQEQFQDRHAAKTYIALVDGHPPTPTGRVEAAIGRHPAQRKRMAIRPAGRGREAVSEYRTLESFDRFTLLEVHPLTGRTHQIRLHCAFLDCPIVGDTLYGHRHSTLPLDRCFLHALRLSIRLPGEETPHTFEAPLPQDLVELLERVRSKMV